MNPKKFEVVYAGLTSVARKVFDATPMSEPWSASRIVAEMARKGSQQDHRVVLGAMCDLCGRKLVREVSTGMFQRMTTDHPTPPETPMPEPTTRTNCTSPKAGAAAAKAAPRKRGPMELLADLSAKARQFAEELDNAALEIEQEFQNSEAKSAKLQQLQALLKGIAD